MQTVFLSGFYRPVSNLKPGKGKVVDSDKIIPETILSRKERKANQPRQDSGTIPYFDFSSEPSLFTFSLSESAIKNRCI
jgi:hypothetical protein